MALQNVQWYGIPVVLSANGVVSALPGATLIGVIVSSHTSGTIKFWDNASAASGTVLVDTYTYATGSQSIIMFGSKCVNGIFADMGGTTQKITVVYNPKNG